MKFIAGLLVGAMVTLLIASLTTYRWEPPSRLAVATASVSPQEVAPEPIRSVTIEPLPPEQLPKPAPKPELERATDLASELAAGPVDRTAVIERVDTAVIWKPFHSEVSATGFARRLSVQLGYPFRAMREGPARYHVVFDYDTEQQRELLQKQVSALTGFNAS